MAVEPKGVRWYPTSIEEAHRLEKYYATLKRGKEHKRALAKEWRRTMADHPPLTQIVNALRSNVNSENWPDVEEWLQALEAYEHHRTCPDPESIDEMSMAEMFAELAIYPLGDDERGLAILSALMGTVPVAAYPAEPTEEKRDEN